jgi:hypothetical protein
MKTEHQLALQNIATALQSSKPALEALTDTCRILQRLPGYTGVYLYAL